MNRQFIDSQVLKDTKCMICGRVHNTNVLADISMSQKTQINGDDCYIFYKRLLAIYGTSYIDVLNSY